MNLDERIASLRNRLDDRLNSITENGVIVSDTETSNTDSNNDRGHNSYCPNCGNPIPEDANFCPECGYNIKAEYFKDNSTTYANNGEGIIMTDTRLLAQKYKTSKEEIKSIVNNFIEDCNESLHLKWHMLDIDNLQDEIGEATWMDYSDVLEEFCERYSIKKGPQLSLFIIGGNDVIPQPCEDNPSYYPEGDGYDEFKEKVYSDFYYCFYGKLQLDYLDYNKARCNVSRLPLENGYMNTSAHDDLGKYLHNTIACMANGGIEIGRAVMTSNSEWIPASREMSRNLPTESLENVTNEVLDNMYLSPDVIESMDNKLRKKYYNSLAKADMLVFNLHGHCHPQLSGFYSTELAFSPEMLSETKAKIFNTVACWGDRYISYERENSMLLTALYDNDVLLYSGACVPAMGKCGNYQYDTTWRIQPAAYSETFMARFTEYQCIGRLSAGEAFLKAKCDYYNTSRVFEDDETTLATVLMFNLYGCPAIRTRPNISAIAEIQHVDGSKMCRIPFRKSKKITLVDKNSKTKNGSVLDAVRNSVDSNLSRIHSIVVERLYNALGVTERELSLIEQHYTTDISGKAQKGYIYHYTRNIGKNIKTHIQVKLDEAGNIRESIQTK